MNRQQRRAAERQGKAAPAPAAGGNSAGEFLFAQAVELHRVGRLLDADRQLQRLPKGDPREADGLHLRGLIALQGGRAAEARPLMAAAIALDAGVAVYHNNLGMALRGLGRHAEAEAPFRRALALRADYPKAESNLGQTLAALGRFDEARPLLERAVARTPGDADLWLALAAALQGQGAGAATIEALRRAAAVTPSAAIHGALGGAFERDVRLTEAAGAYREAARLAGDPSEAAQALNGLGNALTNLGDLDGAVAVYRQSLAHEADPSIASNYLMTLHSLGAVTAADLLAEARRLAPPVAPRPRAAFRNRRDAERPLRVGYVSADFRTHPVGFFLERTLAAHDPAQVAVTLYSNSAYADDLTARLRASAAGWRSIADVDDGAAAAMIAADEIDVLVDLAGHTGSNRLPLFAARAAPVQASWLGYFGTTGVPAMDYVLADAVVAPPAEDALFSETVVRLRSPYLAWTPPREAVETGPFPALAEGVVTFGCFNNRAKLGPETLDAWARILNAVAGSRLFLKSWSLGDAGCREGLARAFEARGVARGRLIFEGLTPRAQALAAYNRVDIALDPFPFGGCTTTADTLWMGVPLISLAGGRWSGRMSQTILESVGFGAWVAPDVEAYVAMAVAMAGQAPAMADVRAGLRARLEASAFCDAPGLARSLEGAYRDMWRAWCVETAGS